MLVHRQRVLLTEVFKTYNTHHMQTRPQPLVNLVPVAIKLQNCQLRLKALITHSLTHKTYNKQAPLYLCDM